MKKGATTTETTQEEWGRTYKAHDFKPSTFNNLIVFEANITAPGFEHLGVKRVKMTSKDSAVNLYGFFLIGSADDWRDLNASKAAS